jgi:hypothetical protein
MNQIPCKNCYKNIEEHSQGLNCLLKYEYGWALKGTPYEPFSNLDYLEFKYLNK